jgi:protein TonB
VVAQRVAEKVVEKFVYPKALAQTRTESTVQLRLVVGRNGDLLDVTASGTEPVVTDAVLAAARQAAPFPPPPPARTDRVVLVLPMQFRVSG